jgi:hypothetical protein
MRRPFLTRPFALGLWGLGAVGACVRTTLPPEAPPVRAASASATSAPVTEGSTSPSAPLPTTLMPGIGMAPSKPAAEPDEHEPSGPPPACSKDEDCWSKTCCPAKAPEECVHALKARRCAVVDLSCPKTTARYTCFCDAGACRGRLPPSP